MSALAVEMLGIDKAFPGVVANRAVDFSATWGEVHAVLGENGAGKTTLMSILAGLYRPDRGQIRIDGAAVTFRSPKDAIQHGVGMVYQHYRLVPSQSVAENLLLGLPGVPFRLNARGFIRQASDLGERYHLRIDPSRPVWQLSVGEQQRVEILKTLQRGARIVILDEPTAVLTPQESEDLMRTMRQIAAEGRTVVLISHKLEEVRSVADHVSVLRNGASVASGVPIGGMTTRELARLMVGDDERSLRSARGEEAEAVCNAGSITDLDAEQNSYEVNRLRAPDGEAVREASETEAGQSPAPARGQAGDQRSLRSANDLQTTDVTRGPTTVGESRLAAAPRHGGEKRGEGVARLVLDNIEALDDRGLTALKGLNLTLKAGEILGIAGVAGNGQRELAQVITGLRALSAGRILLDGRDVTRTNPRDRTSRGIAHIPEDRVGEGLVGNLPVSDNAILRSYEQPIVARGWFLDPRRVLKFTQTLLERFRISARPESITRLLSGGQLQRLLLAREMALDPNLIVAVHPTRGLDVAATAQVQQWLVQAAQTGTAVLLISEDLDEILHLSDRVAVLYEGRIIGSMPRAQAERASVGLMMAGSRPAAAGVA